MNSNEAVQTHNTRVLYFYLLRTKLRAKTESLGNVPESETIVELWSGVDPFCPQGFSELSRNPLKF